MLILIAKLGTPAVVGQFNVGLAVTAPLIIFSQMQLRQLQVTDIAREYTFADYLSLRVLATMAALALIAAEVFLLGYRGDTAVVAMLVGVAKAFDSISDAAYGHLQAQERMDRIARSMIAKGILGLLAVGVLLRLTRNLPAAIGGMAASSALVLFLYDLRVARGPDREAVRLAWRPRKLLRLAVVAFPLAIAAGAVSLAGNAPRLFLERFHGLSEVGLYAAAASPLPLLALLPSALNQAALPRAARYYQTGERRLFLRLAAKVTAIYLGLSALALGFFAVAGEFFLIRFFAPEYRAGVPVLLVICTSVLVTMLGTLGSFVIVAGRMFRLQTWNAFLILAAQVGLSALLVPAHGARGAAEADLCKSAATTLFLSAIAVFQLFRWRREAHARSPEASGIPGQARL